MTYDALLALLQKPRRTALRHGLTRAHRAFCPACQSDGGDSLALSVAETDDGTILLHCFKGCDAGTIAAALDVDMSELFPARFTAGEGAAGAAKPIASWASAIAFADAMDAAAWSVLLHAQDDPIPAYRQLQDAIEGFKAAAHDAMRGSARRAAR